MLGGYQRKLYYIKDTGSKLFREAYFVLREGADMSFVCENDLAAEADRILRERFPAKRRRLIRPRTVGIITFAVGIAVGATLAGIIL